MLHTYTYRPSAFTCTLKSIVFSHNHCQAVFVYCYVPGFWHLRLWIIADIPVAVSSLALFDLVLDCNLDSDDLELFNKFYLLLHLLSALLCERMLCFTMDVGVGSGKTVNTAQGRLLGEHHQWLMNLQTCISHLDHQDCHLWDNYRGDPARSKGFLLQCICTFTNVLWGQMPDEETMVELINLLSEKAQL